MTAMKTCFIIAPIGEPNSTTRKRSDLILKYIIRPAVEKCGYNAKRADKIDKPGIITSQVIQHVVEDPLVIADLTDLNPNVFYELAIRHSISKPLIQIIQKNQQIPFDIAGMRTISVDHHDLENVELSKNEITQQIKSIEEDPTKVETPISVALDLQHLRKSGDPEERSTAGIMATVAEMKTSLNSIDKLIRNPRELLPEFYIAQIIEASKSGKMNKDVSDLAYKEMRYLFDKIKDCASVDKKLYQYIEDMRLLLKRELGIYL